MRAQRIGQRVAAGGVHRPEANATIVGGQHHAGARFGVLTIGDRPGEIAPNQGNAN